MSRSEIGRGRIQTSSIRELLDRFVSGDLAPEARREAIALLAGQPTDLDPVALLYVFASTPRPRFGVQDAEPGSAGEATRLPSILTQDFSEPFGGAAILEELHDDLGLLLWQLGRDVQLWSWAAPRDRSDLFAASAHERRRAVVEELTLPASTDVWLMVLAAIPKHPTTISARAVAVACIELARFALGEAHPRSAFALARTAAVALPSCPWTAREIGVVAFETGRMEHAEVWFKHAATLARRSDRWEIHSDALNGLGEVALHLGDGAKAHQWFLRALRASRRRCPRARPDAYWGLFRTAIRHGTLQDAQAHARQLRALLPHDPTLDPVEIAKASLHAHRFDDASRLLRQTVDLEPARPHVRALALAALAHLSGVRRAEEEYVATWTEARALLDEIAAPRHRQLVVIELAIAASVAGDPARAIGVTFSLALRDAGANAKR